LVAVPGRKTLLLAAVAALVVVPLAPARDAPLSVRLARALAHGGRTGAVAVDLATGRVVFAHNAGMALVPASNEKLAVAYAALVALGPSYRIRTELVGEGHREGPVWRGNLVLKGRGDPTLSRAGLRGLAHRLRVLGIRRVTGSIVGDESFFDRLRTAAGWKPSFYLDESAPLSALTVDEGRLLAGGVAAQPALVAAGAFRHALRLEGIAVGGPPKMARTGRGVPLAARASPPLAAIVRRMDSRSDNFTAEILLKELGAVAGAGGTTSAGARVAHSVLAEAGVPMAGVRLADGSGLSSLDRLTPSALAAILVRAWQDSKLRDVFVGSLAVSGRTGTLIHRLRGPRTLGRIRAKTGTTDLACALSGYAGRRFAFVVIQNGRPVGLWAAREAQDRFVRVLAAQ
jgi:D-alanyl-D-alanine carboxypeptidase/D-alanyl-D-alanine-endopeptidase (penicillin-binding protein 4)